MHPLPRLLFPISSRVVCIVCPRQHKALHHAIIERLYPGVVKQGGPGSSCRAETAECVSITKREKTEWEIQSLPSSSVVRYHDSRMCVGVQFTGEPPEDYLAQLELHTYNFK